jgi:hypothetical protein
MGPEIYVIARRTSQPQGKSRQRAEIIISAQLVG